MDRGEYAACIRDAVVEAVREKLIAPLVDVMLAEQKRMDVALTSLIYKDFWNYREQMVEISEKHPGLVAEQVYKLAKEEFLLKGN